MGVMIPVATNRRACLAFTWRSTIHASECAVFDLFGGLMDGDRRRAFRTVCGVDAFPLVHGSVDRPGDGIVALWPAPVQAKNADRCPDCAARLGLGGRSRKGDWHWQNLIDAEGDQ